MISEVYNMDCLQGMKEYPDNYFDLAIVDPPYGIDFGNYQRTLKDKLGKRHKNKDWDKDTPNKEYFLELFRVSKNQIVWGGG
jgi:site-specific DNA-methyltransferase (adenine-specific)